MYASAPSILSLESDNTIGVAHYCYFIMHFKEIFKRINGISIPFFGVSWNPDNTERDVARQVITFLEDRRVLFNPTEMEVPIQCVESVIQMRQFLTSKISMVNEDSELSKSLRAMRASCRKFLDNTGYPDGDIIRFGANREHYASWVFNGAVGELRGVFGYHVAKIAVAYGIDVEDDLASILPAEDK